MTEDAADRLAPDVKLTWTIESPYGRSFNRADYLSNLIAGFNQKPDTVHAVKLGGFIEGYMKNEAQIELRSSTGGSPADAGNCVVIVRAGSFEDLNGGDVRTFDISTDNARGWFGNDEFPVVLCVPQLVQSPQGPISSLVWLCRDDGSEDWSRNVGSTLLDILLTVSRRVPKGELCAPRVRTPRESDRGAVNGVIKSGTKLGCRVENAGSYSDGNRALKTDLAKRVAAMRIELMEHGGPLLVLHESEPRTDFMDVVVRAIH